MSTSPHPRARPLIGAHIKTTGGFSLVPERAATIGAEAVQIFDSSPRTWKPRAYDPVQSGALRDGLRAEGIPLFFHAIYLINLASPDPELRSKSVGALAEALFTGAVTGAAGVVVHVGSHRGEGFETVLPWVRESILAAHAEAETRLAELSLSEPLPRLLMESTAGSKNTMGRDLAELEAMVALCADTPAAETQRIPDCGICLDTAHLFASGYPIHTPEGLEEFVDELRARGLADRVGLFHLNDSKSDFASGRDLHDNLGEGMIGYEALARVIRHPAFETVPFALEVPGFDGQGPDAANIDIAKAMRAGTPAPQDGPAPLA